MDFYGISKQPQNIAIRFSQLQIAIENKLQIAIENKLQIAIENKLQIAIENNQSNTEDDVSVVTQGPATGH